MKGLYLLHFLLVPGLNWSVLTKYSKANPSILREIIGRTDNEAEAPIHWPPDTKRGLIGEDPDAGKD